MNWKTEPYLVVDTESTGLDIETAEIVEVGFAVFEHGEPVLTDSMLVRPTIPIPTGATEIHGITDAMVADAPTIEEVGPKVIEALSKFRTVAGHNFLGYDGPLLSRLVPGFRDACKGHHFLDTLALVRHDDVGRWWKGKGRHRLSEAYRRSGLDGPHDTDPDEMMAHRAVADCVMSGRLLWRWMDVLPDDGREAQRAIVAWRKQQDADFQAWLAKQPKMEGR